MRKTLVLGTLIFLVSFALILSRPLGAEEEGSQRDETMQELERYVGHWLAEIRKGTDEREFRYHYKLEWFDPAHSIIKMTINKVYTDGEAQILWEGFKGWDPVKKEVYYYGFSPSSRAGMGALRKEGNLLHTEYRGFDPRGKGVQIRDTFTPLDTDSFRSETFILRDGNWTKVNTDSWQRKK